MRYSFMDPFVGKLIVTYKEVPNIKEFQKD